MSEAFLVVHGYINDATDSKTKQQVRITRVGIHSEWPMTSVNLRREVQHLVTSISADSYMEAALLLKKAVEENHMYQWLRPWLEDP